MTITITSAGENKIIVTEEDAVTRCILVLVKPLPTLKCSTQVNKFNEAVGKRFVTTPRTEEDKFVGSVFGVSCSELSRRSFLPISGTLETLVNSYPQHQVGQVVKS